MAGVRGACETESAEGRSASVGTFLPLPRLVTEPFLKFWGQPFAKAGRGGSAGGSIAQLPGIRSARFPSQGHPARISSRHYVDAIVYLPAPNLSACGPACAKRSAAGRHASLGASGRNGKRQGWRELGFPPTARELRIRLQAMDFRQNQRIGTCRCSVRNKNVDQHAAGPATHARRLKLKSGRVRMGCGRVARCGTSRDAGRGGARQRKSGGAPQGAPACFALTASVCWPGPCSACRSRYCCRHR